MPLFAASAVAVALAFLGALALPGGKMAESHSERMVMAEMTTIDAEHEPEGVGVESVEPWLET